MTCTLSIFDALDFVKNAEISLNMPILQLKAVKAPKSDIFTIMPYKPTQSTIFQKILTKIAKANR